MILEHVKVEKRNLNTIRNLFYASIYEIEMITEVQIKQNSMQIECLCQDIMRETKGKSHREFICTLYSNLGNLMSQINDELTQQDLGDCKYVLAINKSA